MEGRPAAAEDTPRVVEPDGRAYLALSALAAAIGIPAALLAALFLALVHEVEGWLWDDLPDSLGYDVAAVVPRDRPAGGGRARWS